MTIAYYSLSKEVMSHFLGAKNKLDNSSLPYDLIELIYLRISQINGCFYCIKMHTEALKKHHVDENKINSIENYSKSTYFSNKEKAAFNWAESITLIIDKKASKQDLEKLKFYFNDQEISDLSFAISLMNAFNRMAIAFQHG